MAEKVTGALTGAGIWGVEFFLTEKGVYFSELSPRPHDTGMVTLAGTQNMSEFELHAKAILGLPIPEVILERHGASAVVLADKEGKDPDYAGIEKVLASKQTNLRIFGKPATRPYRRMAVVLTYGDLESNVEQITQRAIALSKEISIKVR
jgi:phosphoribosylglycinamide formyltransferase 2